MRPLHFIETQIVSGGTSPGGIAMGISLAGGPRLQLTPKDITPERIISIGTFFSGLVSAGYAGSFAVSKTAHLWWACPMAGLGAAITVGGLGAIVGGAIITGLLSLTSHTTEYFIDFLTD